MRPRHSVVISFLFVMFLMLVLPYVTQPGPFASASNGLTTLCSSLPKNDQAGAIYPAIGGAFVEDYLRGNLVFCSGGHSKTIATAPPGGIGPYAPGPYFDGMGAVQTQAFGLVLALVTHAIVPGFWICYHAAYSGCGSKSAFIPLPSSFCSSELVTACEPTGAALDSSLNLYYADYENQQLVECTRASSYHSCLVLPASKDLAGHAVDCLYLSGTTFYLADGYNGPGRYEYIWKGTSQKLTAIGKYYPYFPISAIALSSNNPSKTPHVYLAIASLKFPLANYVYDLTDKKTLSYTAFTSSTNFINGLDSNLQFTTYNPRAAYQTSDSS
jgi:hypothetical protein